MTYEFRLLSKTSPFLYGGVSTNKEFEEDRNHALSEVAKTDYAQTLLCRVSSWTIQFFVSSLIKKGFCVMYENKHDISTYTWRWKSKYIDMDWQFIELEFDAMFGKQIQERNQEYDLKDYESNEIWHVLKTLHGVIKIADTFEIN